LPFLGMWVPNSGFFCGSKRHYFSPQSSLLALRFSRGMISLLLCALLQTPPPTLEPWKPARRVDAPLWLFPVADDEGTIVLSSENTRHLRVATTDLENLRIRWKDAAGSEDTAGQNISDHWHIFAHGHHWLSFSTGSAQQSYLLKLDKNLKRVGLWPLSNQKGLPTNDHFLVAEPDGVAVGHFRPGYGHRIFRFDKEGKPRGTVDVGGGAYRHGNGSSAIPLQGGYRILATETLNMVQQGGVFFLETDANWKPKASKLVIDEDRKNVAMASGIVLESGYTILHARVCDKACPRGEMPPPPSKDQKGLAPDDGAIVRYVISPERKIVSREELAERGNRPHTTLVGDLLITTWDGQGTTLRVDRVR